LRSPSRAERAHRLRFLFREETHQIHINDADPSIHALWWALTRRAQQFVKLLRSTPVTMKEWRLQRAVYRSRPRARLKRAFATFYLNRCNRSGIVMNGGPIGGIHQKGKWKLRARFNKEELAQRCMRVGEYRERIDVSKADGLDFISRVDHGRTFLFIDPPYFVKGPELYLNALDAAYHTALADQLSSMRDTAWVLTYDDCQEVRSLYRGWASLRPFSLRYAAARRRAGRELLITPKWMSLPARQESAAIGW
jgi:DNA adenine methylase